jgi:hypothetical protein
MAVNIETTVSGDVMPDTSEERYRRFERNCSFHLQDRITVSNTLNCGLPLGPRMKFHTQKKKN